VGGHKNHWCYVLTRAIKKILKWVVLLKSPILSIFKQNAYTPYTNRRNRRKQEGKEKGRKDSD